MDDIALIRTYVTGIFMLAFLDEYEKHERIYSFAKVYNTIIKKNGNFQDQINDLAAKRIKKISHKAKLFSIASECAIIAWDKGIKDTKGLSISAGSAIANLYRLDSENFSRIFNLGEKEFQYIGRSSQAGVTLSSCKMSRFLMEHVAVLLDDIFTKKDL